MHRAIAYPEIYTVEEFGKIFKLSPKTVLALIRKREIPAIRIGSTYRIPQDVVDRYFAQVLSPKERGFGMWKQKPVASRTYVNQLRAQDQRTPDAFLQEMSQDIWVSRRTVSHLVDTDIFIDYLNGTERMQEALDSPQAKLYYSIVTKHELLKKPGLSATERRRIRLLLAKHRLIPLNAKIAQRFSFLLTKYEAQGLRKADALIAATAWFTKLPLLTRNLKHYRFISEIKLADLP
jgi:excisionase family DNA binding protein